MDIETVELYQIKKQIKGIGGSQEWQLVQKEHF